MTLEEYFAETPKAALALSGGTDSSYLLYAAKKAEADVKPYYIKTYFQPAFELEDARRIAEICNSELTVLEMDILSDKEISCNSELRCYYCKTALFRKLIHSAGEDGYLTIIDGTNASDEVSERPGMKAIEEMHVRSPLRECGITKQQVRTLSAEAGLFTADKPSYSCLATRIKSGQIITQEKLIKTENAEKILFDMGFSDFRVRLVDDIANVQFSRSQLMSALGQWDTIRAKLKKHYTNVVVDLKGR